MIQRPQTLVLLAAIICLIITNFFSVSEYQPEKQSKKGDIGFYVRTTDVGFYAIPRETLSELEEAEIEAAIKNANEYMDKSLEEKGLSIIFTLGGIGMIVLIALVILMIAKYNNRKFQVRLGWMLTAMLIVLTVGLYFGAGFGLEVLKSSHPGYEQTEWVVSYGAGMFLPMIAAVLIVMANILIRKDERLISSVDRIR